MINKEISYYVYMGINDTAEIMGRTPESISTAGFRLDVRNISLTDEYALHKLRTRSAELREALQSGKISNEDFDRALARCLAELLTDSRYDGKTKLFNRQAFYPENLEDKEAVENSGFIKAFRAVERAQASLVDPEKIGGDPRDLDCSVLFIDGDKFKKINDTYGHDVGDALLKIMAKSIAYAAIRPEDIACRYGGEEFVALLPRTNRAGALKVAERIHETYTYLQLKANLENSVPDDQTEDRHLRLTKEEIEAVRKIQGLQTMSIGLRTYIPGEDTRDNFIKQADRATYKAKNAKDYHRTNFLDAVPHGFTMINSSRNGNELYTIANPPTGMGFIPPPTPSTAGK